MTMNRKSGSGERHRPDRGPQRRDGAHVVLTMTAGDVDGDAPPPAALIAHQARYNPLCVPIPRKATR